MMIKKVKKDFHYMPRRSILEAGLISGVLVSPLAAAVAQTLSSNNHHGSEGLLPPGSAEITVDQARAQPIPIVVPPLGSDLGLQIAEVITNDLNGSGLFKVIFSAVVPAQQPDFTMYKALGARAVITGNNSGTNNARVEFRLWDVLTQQQLQGTAYTTTAENWRRIAHIIADAIYERLLGEKGYFDTRIAFVAKSGPLTRPITRLAIMDQDGANVRYLSNGRWLVLTPRFNPKREQIAFMSYVNTQPRVYLFDLKSGSQRLLGEFDGMSFAPRFSPDGAQLLLSATRGGGSDIYIVDVDGGAKHQLTRSGAIDTSPCFSPDKSKIVFNSDRGGSPQLYVMNNDGSNVQRISYGKGSYGSPVWSPRGDLIAFSRINNRMFSLGVMESDGSGERILIEAYTVESPSFCPNGRVIAFCRQSEPRAGSSSRIGTIDIAGFNERTINLPGNASDPAWSTLNSGAQG